MFAAILLFSETGRTIGSRAFVDEVDTGTVWRVPVAIVVKEEMKLQRRTALFVVLTAGSILGFRHLGLWLEVKSPLEPSRAIVVMGGGFPYRAAEAARLYKAGWAHEVWLTQGSRDDRDRTLEFFGIPLTSRHESGRWLLLKAGVPETAIQLVPGTAEDTVSELRSVLRYSQNGPAGPLIFVTSPVHSRRVKVIWNAVSTGRKCIVHYTPADAYHASAWWGNRADAGVTLRETFGILNAWVGFPVRRAS